MINILFIENNMKYCQKIVNNLNLINDNYKFCCITNNEEEIVKALNYLQIDVILINLKLFKEFYQYLKEHYKSIVLILDNIEKMKNKKFLQAYEYICRSDDISKVHKICNKIYKSSYVAKEKIHKELDYLGYSFKYAGTRYLYEAISILHKNKKYNCRNLEKEIYPIIAKKYDKTINNIKCNIIHATDIMIFECEEEKLLKYLGYCNYSKPGPKRIIETVLGKLSMI